MLARTVHARVKLPNMFFQSPFFSRDGQLRQRKTEHANGVRARINCDHKTSRNSPFFKRFKGTNEKVGTSSFLETHDFFVTPVPGTGDDRIFETELSSTVSGGVKGLAKVVPVNTNEP